MVVVEEINGKKFYERNTSSLYELYKGLRSAIYSEISLTVNQFEIVNFKFTVNS